MSGILCLQKRWRIAGKITAWQTGDGRCGRQKRRKGLVVPPKKKSLSTKNLTRSSPFKERAIMTRDKP
jgi:hypothetical protein